MTVSPVPVRLAGLAATLATITSLAGIGLPDTYARETAAWALQGVGQDWANLVVVIVLFWSSALMSRGSVPALHVWLGGLLYLIYAFAIYAFAVHFNSLFLIYVAVLGLSFYALVGTLLRLDFASVTGPLMDHPHRKGAGNLLVSIGVLFAILWLAEIVPHLLARTVPASLAETALLTNPVHVLDLACLLPAMILVGILLHRQHPVGLLFAPPLLVFASTMGLGILAIFALSAARHMPVAWPAVVVVSLIVGLSGVYSWLLLRAYGRPHA